MRRALLGIAFVFLVAVQARPLEVPKLQARVTDLAGVLTPDQTAALEQKLKDLETTDSTQVAVLIIPSLEGESLEDYSVRVASAWKLGQKGTDNGALLLVAMKERQVRIEVGYGLEPTLTDARSVQIIQNEIVPNFRAGGFYAGIDAGVNAISQVVRGVYQPMQRPSRPSSGGPLNWIILLFFPLLWVLSAIGKWGGAILGGLAGVLLPYSFFGPFLFLLLGGGVVGALAGMFLGAILRAGASTRGTPRGFGGPFWGGGGFGGGGFGGGGGFSGGGGGFGGGGSSGRW